MSNNYWQGELVRLRAIAAEDWVHFDELRYQKVNVYIYDFNSGSIELHRRLGFQEEGRLRRMGYTQGQHYDWLLLGMTREEFAAGHA